MRKKLKKTDEAKVGVFNTKSHFIEQLTKAQMRKASFNIKKSIIDTKLREITNWMETKENTTKPCLWVERERDSVDLVAVSKSFTNGQ